VAVVGLNVRVFGQGAAIRQSFCTQKKRRVPTDTNDGSSSLSFYRSFDFLRHLLFRLSLPATVSLVEHARRRPNGSISLESRLLSSFVFSLVPFSLSMRGDFFTVFFILLAAAALISHALSF